MKTKNLIQTIREKNKLIERIVDEGLSDTRKILDLEEDQEKMLDINIKLVKEVDMLQKKLNFINGRLDRQIEAKEKYRELYEEKQDMLAISNTRRAEYNTFLYYIRMEPWYKIFSLRKRITDFFELNNKV